MWSLTVGRSVSQEEQRHGREWRSKRVGDAQRRDAVLMKSRSEPQQPACDRWAKGVDGAGA